MKWSLGLCPYGGVLSCCHGEFNRFVFSVRIPCTKIWPRAYKEGPFSLNMCNFSILMRKSLAILVY